MRRLTFLLAMLFATPALAQPATTKLNGGLVNTPLSIQPASQSQTGWTSTGARFANPSVTLTDTSTAAGTVANGYTDLFSGDTIATSTNAVTFTNYYGSYFAAPIAGTHVTMTNKWALGADSFKVNGALSVTGAITATGLSSGTQTSCLGLSSLNAVVLSTGACAGSITAGTTPTSGITSTDFISSTSNLVADSAITVPLTQYNTSYWYPYGVCNVQPCSTGVAGVQQYLGSATPALMGPGAPLFLSYNVIGLSDYVLNPIAIGDSPSSIPSQTFTSKTFSLTFTSGSITGSPVTITYTGTGADTAATVATGLCNAVTANSNLTNVIVCDPAAGGGTFNLQWSVLVNPTVTSTGTGTITLATPDNNLDGVFWLHTRRITGYTLTSGDLVGCDIYYFNNIKLYQTCTNITGSSGGVPLLNLEFDLAAGSSGDIAAFKITSTGPLVPNSGTGVSLYFGSNAGAADARIFENSGNSLQIALGSNNEFVIGTYTGTNLMDYNATTTNAWTITHPLYLTGLPSSGGNLYLCINSSTGQVSAQSAAC